MSKRKNISLAAGLAVILGGLGYLLFGKLEKNIVYFVTPTELVAKGELAYDTPVRLGGMVKKGTIQWDAQKILLQFLMTDGTQEISVVSNAAPPQMFQEEMGVVVEGRFNRGEMFVANRLMVRHSNEYHPPKAGEKPHILYKDLVR